jgi:hypothetical protein
VLNLLLVSTRAWVDEYLAERYKREPRDRSQ